MESSERKNEQIEIKQEPVQKTISQTTKQKLWFVLNFVRLKP